MLPSQSAFLLPDTEVKHLTVLWKPGQDPSTPGTLTEPKALFIMNWICKISTIQQQQSKQRVNVVSLNEVLSGWRALTHLALIKSIIRLWWRSGMWGMPVDFSHLCDNHSQTLDSLILFLMAPRQPQCLSLIFPPSQHLAQIYQNICTASIIPTWVADTNGKKEEKVLSWGDILGNRKKNLRVIVTAVWNQSDTYFQEWWASSCGASF